MTTNPDTGWRERLELFALEDHDDFSSVKCAALRAALQPEGREP